MNKTIMKIVCTMILVAGFVTAASGQVQFSVPITVTNGVSQQVFVGVSGDGVGGIQDNTIGADTDTSFGAYREELAPPAPPAPFPFDARILTIPGRVSTFPTGLGSGVYKDYRGWDSYLQVDTFKIAIAGDNVDLSTTNISWPAGLGAYGSSWVILPQSGSEWGPVDMIANTNAVIPAAVLQRSILIIKTGAGPAGPVFALNPSSLNFGSVPVGSSSATQSVTVTNPSTTNSLSFNVTADPDYVVTPDNAVVPAGGSQVVDVQFTPTAIGNGGDLYITHNASGSPDTLQIVSVGQDSTPVFALDPAFLNFGVVAVGSNSTIQTVYLSNPSPTNALSFNFVADPDYLVTPSSGSVPAGDTVGVDVRFTPTAPGDGGDLYINHSGAGSPDTLQIVAVGQDTSKYLTLSPDTIAAKDPIKGKFFKSVKRGKGLYPNWANLIEETVVQGGFQPGATESDTAGGMVVGHSWMENVGGKFKAIKDSAKVRGWVRNTKWNPVKGGKSYSDLQKTMEDKTGSHVGLGTVRGFDTFANVKPFVKEVKKLAPKKQANKLYAELVALKFNIAASQLAKTPVGFGELIFDTDGNLLDELSVKQISAKADTLMTYWQGVSQTTYDSVYNAVYRINRAFLGVLDTITFGTKLTVKGVTNSTTFLKAPVGPAPVITLLVPFTDRTEEDPSFDGDDSDEDSENMPVAAQLDQNFPNPFNPSTTIGFRLRSVSTVSISVFNLLGQVVGTLMQDEEFDEGYQSVDFSAAGLSSGVYLYRIEARSVENTADVSIETRKMMLLK